MPIKSHLPNLLTCANMVCGSLALVMVMSLEPSKLIWASYLVGLAAVFDFLDGMAARLLKSYTDFGKQLDSLADMLSFGVVPGVIMYSLILNEANMGEEWLAYCGLLIPIFSALRLAKYNISDNQSDSFIGLPTPANALLIASLPLVLEHGNLAMLYVVESPHYLAAMSALLSLLLVSKIGMFSLKVKTLKLSENKLQVFFLLLSLIIIVVFQFTAVPIIIILYIAISTIKSLFFK
ncbi:MAG TPA: CDP-diacylglycerol--serine O-phosphatidyltransferase [Flavobacteriales bacterium]|nr:CDP-diacylglycerol--serine O-phosphatidyltransferase [Flavobacteriales bacterium]